MKTDPQTAEFIKVYFVLTIGLRLIKHELPAMEEYFMDLFNLAWEGELINIWVEI